MVYGNFLINMNITYFEILNNIYECQNESNRYTYQGISLTKLKLEKINDIISNLDASTKQIKDADLENAILTSDFELLDVIPADSSSKTSDIMLDEMKGNKNRLKQVIKQLAGEYDFLFIDCPPGFSALSENIFNASDIVLMPVIPSTLSIRTYHMVKDYFKEKDLDISKMMCFFTMTDLRKTMHNDIMAELYKDKRFFQNYIPYLSDVEKMGVHKAPIMEFANSSYAAKCYRELWTEIKEGVL